MAGSRASASRRFPVGQPPFTRRTAYFELEETQLATTAETRLSHATNIIPPRTSESFNRAACHECKTSCQSACKTSCTVGNQPCARTQ
ncbi:MAG: six-cysteine peptide SCIFF [Firmicutes bacterium]|nr:six-cysteine peptide SCIFF [Bacillota bacterium]